MYPPQSPTRITNNSILKLPGGFHCVKTSRILFCAFSYSIGEPCGRSVHVSMYFKVSSLPANRPTVILASRAHQPAGGLPAGPSPFCVHLGSATFPLREISANLLILLVLPRGIKPRFQP